MTRRMPAFHNMRRQFHILSLAVPFSYCINYIYIDYILYLSYLRVVRIADYILMKNYFFDYKMTR